MVRLVSTVIVVLAATAAPAAAQAPSYGGGSLPASPSGGFTPTVGIVLQPRPDGIALRFDTILKCGRTLYEAVGRKVVPFDGRRFRARGASVFRIGGDRSRNRVIFGWRLRGQADGSAASGRLRIEGVRIVGGRRTACTRKPVRRFRARLAAPTPPGSPVPPGGAGFGGLSDVFVAGLPAPVVVRVTRNARRAGARWTVFADCGRGPRADLVNFTPLSRLRPDGSFSRSERFSVSYADAFIRYRVRFTGRISGEGASGTFRMRARRFSPNGRRLRTRCDSGTRNWTAAMLRPVAPG